MEVMEFIQQNQVVIIVIAQVVVAFGVFLGVLSGIHEYFRGKLRKKNERLELDLEEANSTIKALKVDNQNLEDLVESRDSEVDDLRLKAVEAAAAQRRFEEYLDKLSNSPHQPEVKGVDLSYEKREKGAEIVTKLEEKLEAQSS